METSPPNMAFRRDLLVPRLVSWNALLQRLANVVIKAIDNNEERKRNHSTETQDFNVENPLQQREVKTTGASQQNFTISGVFTNAVGNPNDVIQP
jgi:hypothetical protein